MLKRYDNYFCRVSGIYYLTFRLQAMLLSWIHDIWLFVHRYMTFDFLFTCTWHLTFCLQVHDIGLFVYRFMTSDCLFTGTWYLTVCLQVHDICLFVYRNIYLTVCLQVHNTLVFVYRYLTSDFLFTGTLHLTFWSQEHDIWLFVYRHIISDFLFRTQKYDIWRPWWRTTDVHGCQGPLEEGQCRH